MVLKRKIYKSFLDWKANWAGKRALLVQGARRIGKSTIVEEFAKNEYETYILINFQSDLGKVEQLFKNDISDLDTFFRNLSLLYGKRLIERKSLIIFDEVQLFPLARQSIKQLVADGRYDYIETGSLITLKQNVEKILIPSEEKSINMYPLDFEEFLWARGDTVTADIIRDCFLNLKEKTQTAQAESHKNASKEPCAKLLPLETQFSFAWTFPEVTSLLGKKLCFEIENINKEDAKPPYKISSVECEYEG